MLKKWVGLRFLLLVVPLSLPLVVLGCSSGGTKAESPTTTGGTVATTSNLPVTTTSSVASAPIPTTDTTEADTSSSTTAPDAVATSPAVELLAKGLSMFALGVSWSFEPRGDITGDTGAGELIYAEISKVSPDGSTVTLDALQVYVGSPIAEQQAAKDGISLTDTVVYYRNAFEHSQTLPLADEASIIVYAGDVGDTSHLQQLNTDGIGLVGATPAQFARLFQDETSGFPGGFPSSAFWVFVDRGKITGIFEPYSE